ncbi:MAG TPA: EF-hand domain-containing protein [Gammaproteobacteria bacterium]|nr:EF-hand domain-containing protein [Gammaproteobacteria bacterium]
MKKIVVASALAAAAGWAFAQPPGGFTPPSFAGLDTDKSGGISQAEVAAFFANAPANANRPPPEQIFANWDANKDGSVSQAEFDARPRPQGPGGPPPAR